LFRRMIRELRSRRLCLPRYPVRRAETGSPKPPIADAI
jgi:hypothetical protein